MRERMIKIKRLTALLLCLIMIMPSQQIVTFAETAEGGTAASADIVDETEAPAKESLEEAPTKESPPEETQAKEATGESATEDSSADTPSETKQAAPTEISNPIIYLNPGSLSLGYLATPSNADIQTETKPGSGAGNADIPTSLATPSNADNADSTAATKNAADEDGPADIVLASASNSSANSKDKAKPGRDSADGRSPSTPVKTLEAAFARADELLEEGGYEPSDITICMMNPLELESGQFAMLNGGGVSVVPWEGRTYDSDVLFYVSGGQLLLSNVRLEGGAESDSDTELIRVDSGSLQLGGGVTIEGRTVMDYRKHTETPEWVIASASNAAAAGSAAGSAAKTVSDGASDVGFDLNDYVFSIDTDMWEVFTDATERNTGRRPIIELTGKFDGTGGEYLLEVWSEEASEAEELVRTLYADDTSAEEFQEYFSLYDQGDQSWRLEAVADPAVMVYDTGSSEDLRRMYSMSEADYMAEDSVVVRDTGSAEDLLRLRSMAPANVMSEDSDSLMTVKTLMATRAASLAGAVYWNPGGAIQLPGVADSYPAGNDLGVTGAAPTAPFKTLEAAMVKAGNGGVVVCMQPVDVKVDGAEYLGGFLQADGSYLIKSPSSTSLITIKAWDKQPQPAFIVGAGEKMTFEDIILEGAGEGTGLTSNVLVLAQNGDITINQGVTAESGFIQIDASENLKAHPLTVSSQDGGAITLFFGGINDNVDHRYTDVVVPGGDLALQAAADPDAVGDALLNRMQLAKSNLSQNMGGQSLFAWELRKDMAEDGEAHPERLELYARYYFDAIYLDGIRGSDDSLGATCQRPVKTWAKAVEVWEREMRRSVAERQAAEAAGEDPSLIALPTKIQICGTVTVEDTQTWSLDTAALAASLGCEETLLKTEVWSHMEDIPLKAPDSAEKLHEPPKVLVQVNSANGKLTLDKLTIRSISDEADSVSVKVTNGGSLTMNADALLTGTIPAAGAAEGKETTKGVHVEVLSGSTFTMNGGRIETRQQGVRADGAGTKVFMNAGTIEKNNGFDAQTAADAQVKGVGVSLTGGAYFEMNGGAISRNKVYQYGGGVWLDGAGTELKLNKGTISENSMTEAVRLGETPTANPMDPKLLRGYGIGVYAGKGTKLTVGDGSGSSAPEAVIEKNTGYYVYGAGVYTEGSLYMDGAAVRDNTCYTGEGLISASYVSANVSMGIGLHAAGSTALEIKNSAITGNRTTEGTREFASVRGAGLYLSEIGTKSSPAVIENCVISDNRIGLSRNLNNGTYTYGAGGGIAVENSWLSVADSDISRNQAVCGAGIFQWNGTADPDKESNTPSQDFGYNAKEIALSNTKVLNNKATRISTDVDFDALSIELPPVPTRDGGGGINFRNGNMRLLAGTQISGNRAYIGGGICAAGYSKLFVSPDGTDTVLIQDNEAIDTGGGIMTGGSANIYLRNAVIEGNKAAYGGGIYNGAAAYLQDTAVRNNTAAEDGGGIWKGRTLVWTGTDKHPVADPLVGNSAKRGGGIWLSGGALLFAPGEAAVIQNTAAEQGSNLYEDNAAYLQLTNGTFKQPEAGDQIPGVYNVYMCNREQAAKNAPALRMDPQLVTIEAKAAGAPDAVWLNSPRDIISYFRPPLSNDAVMPLDLNSDGFAAGNIVITAYQSQDYTRISFSDSMSGTSEGAILTKITTPYAPVWRDAGENMGYAPGRTTPRRLQLARVIDDTAAASLNKYNVVLISEGVYISGTGSDSNSGSSPTDPVKTFAVAKDRLRERIEERALDASRDDGYRPYIFICGPVQVDSDETWELDYNDELFTTTNADYITTETAANAGVADPRILRAQMRRYGTPVAKNPLISVNTGAELTVNTLVVDGMMDAASSVDSSSPIMEVKEGAVVNLNGNAQLMNNARGVTLYGTLNLTGSDAANEVNRQIADIEQSAVVLYKDAKLYMSGDSRIISENQFYTGNRQNRTGVGMTENAASGEVVMRDNSKIIADKNRIYYYGINVNKKTGWSIRMEDSSRIENTLVGIYGLFGGCKVLMSANEDADESAGALIFASGNGIVVTAGTNEVHLKKNACISGFSSTTTGTRASDSGIRIEGEWNTAASPRGDTTVLMEDQSRIERFVNGINSVRSAWQSETAGVVYQYGKIDITMRGAAGLDDNSYGIVENGGVGSADRLSVSMEENTYIRTAASGIGIYLLGHYWSDGTDGNQPSYQNISLSGDARIEGGNHGIVTYGPSAISLKDRAVIADAVQNGIYARRDARTAAGLNKVPRRGQGVITLEGDSRVENNGRGIYLFTETGAYGLPNEWRVTVKDNALVSSQGVNNGNLTMAFGVITTNAVSELHLEDKASVTVENPHADDAAELRRNHAIHSLGALYLAGTVTLKQEIYMLDYHYPIILTSPVPDIPAGKAQERFELLLEDQFAGQIVVAPDPAYPTGDVTDQLKHFHKAAGYGIAADKELRPLAPNIILGGANQVYLSVIGDDANNGYTPTTAVRTFKRAKEILQGAGPTDYFTEGANINICYTNTSGTQSSGAAAGLDILPEDTLWAFDEGGQITNARSRKTWKPVVTRYMGAAGNQRYLGPMLMVNVDNVVFRDITIDGGCGRFDIGDRTVNQYYGAIMTVTGKNIRLSRDCVLQNNWISTWNSDETGTHAGRLYSPGVVLREDASMTVDGATIQGMRQLVGVTGSVSNVTYRGSNASAIAAEDRAKLTLRSCRIERNLSSEERGEEARAAARAAAIVLEDSASMEMSGGTISGNRHLYGNLLAPDENPRYTFGRGAAIAVTGEATAEISGGVIEDNQAYMGSAVYYDGTGKVTISGGTIRNNKTMGATDEAKIGLGSKAPLYVGGTGLELQGAGANITNCFYLDSTDHVIAVSGNMNQRNRLYRVFVNAGAEDGQFHKGSVAVKPDANWISDASGFLQYFQLLSDEYVLDRGQKAVQAPAVAAGIMENQCLILMQYIFLDSVSGNDANNGTNPDDAVATLTRAKAIGAGNTQGGAAYADYYIIYVSGRAVNTAAEAAWELPASVYMCRYTGFPLYKEGGTDVSSYPAYKGPLLVPENSLTIRAVRIYGRRSTDNELTADGSLIQVEDGVTVTLDGGTLLSSNINSTEGGAAFITAGGTLDVRDCMVENTASQKGSAFYLGADAADPDKLGHLKLSGSPSISGSVYLSGTGNATAAYVEPSQDYVPAGNIVAGKPTLRIEIANDYDTRPVIRYPAGVVPDSTQIEHYSFSDSIKALYEVRKRTAPDDNIVELIQMSGLYLNGQAGDDRNDGLTPDTALLTLKGVYNRIADAQREGRLTAATTVYVVDTVDIDHTVRLKNIRVEDGGDIWYTSSQSDDGVELGTSGFVDVKTQVSFIRYAQPTEALSGTMAGYTAPTNKNSLFNVESGGTLILKGITLDGHSTAVVSTNPRLVADGVEAESPLITVLPGGILECSTASGGAGGDYAADSNPDEYQNGKITATTLTNNYNGKVKTKELDVRGGVSVIEGSSAGIELLASESGTDVTGSAQLKSAVLTNLTLGDGVEGGSDVYSNGELKFEDNVTFSGSVFLEGLGTEDGGMDSSRFIKVTAYGPAVTGQFDLKIRDPYRGRKVYEYLPDAGHSYVVDLSIGRLEEEVRKYFSLERRNDPEYHVIQLHSADMIYIDGTNGDDAANAGTTPAAPVRTLKRAYELLKLYGGYRIYVVDTIKVTDNTDLTGTTYRSRPAGGEESVSLTLTDRVEIYRYRRPTDYTWLEGYTVPSFEGPLIEVQGNSRLSLGSRLIVDGHSEPMIGEQYSPGVLVNGEGTSKAPLIVVDQSGTLDMLAGSELRNNHNVYDSSAAGTDGIEGGAVCNSGITFAENASIHNTSALKGSIAYQDGRFTIVDGVDLIKGPENASGGTGRPSFYLTTENSGTADAPVWGEDHVLTFGAEPEETKKFDLEMDNAVKGRDVVVFTALDAPGADYLQDRFVPGSTVPPHLFLVETEEDPMILELQDWEMLKAEVPVGEIYLVLTQRAGIADKAKLYAVHLPEAGETQLFDSPEYSFKNDGPKYAMTVWISGLINQDGSTIELVDSPADAVLPNQLYLGVSGMDTLDPYPDDYGFDHTLPEISIKRSETTAVCLGRLNPGGVGRFKFSAATGNDFVSNYRDLSFPIGGDRQTARDYMDGTDGGSRVSAALQG